MTIVIVAVIAALVLLLLLSIVDDVRAPESEEARMLAELRAFQAESLMRVRRAEREFMENRRFVEEME